jgi:hypothetical protein
LVTQPAAAEPAAAPAAVQIRGVRGLAGIAAVGRGQDPIDHGGLLGPEDGRVLAALGHDLEADVQHHQLVVAVEAVEVVGVAGQRREGRDVVQAVGVPGRGQVREQDQGGAAQIVAAATAVYSSLTESFTQAVSSGSVMNCEFS